MKKSGESIVAKGKYQEWLEPDGLLLLEGWARDGLTDEQLAEKMEISPSTLYEWKVKYPEISEALKKGKEVVDYQVENALLNKALGGDTTAQIFWFFSFTMHSCTAGQAASLCSSSSGLTFSPLARIMRFFLRPVM